jgi:iron complex transport system substrate-binding protein
MMISSLSIRTLCAAVIVSVGFAGEAAAADKANPEAKRIVSIGGTITEILYDLGAQDRIVARDSTSSFPQEAMSKPDVGYMRALSAEGILGQKPDLILMEEGSGPPPVIEILKASEVPVVVIPSPPDGKKIGEKIRDIGAAVGLSDKAEPLAAKTDAAVKELSEKIAKISTAKKKVLFVLSMANGRILAGGANTGAGEIITMAGGENAAASINGYKPLADEAVIAAQPDFVLAMQAGGERAITADKVFAMPSMQTTPAAANKSLVTMDGLLLLGFGPRTPDAARELAAKIYPGALN